MSVEIGIVIRTFNEAALLGRTLGSIMNQNEQSFEIVVVDSGSTDATISIARRYSRLNVIEMPQSKFTYGRALNLGIAHFADRVKYAVMLSAHAIPCHPEWLSELIFPLRRDVRIAGVYGKQIPLPEHMIYPVVRALASAAYPYCYGDKAFKTNTSDFFSNVNAAIRIDSWLAHRFDENMSYCEDWEWCRNAIRAGSYLAYQPGASVYHSHPESYFEYFRRFTNQVRAERSLDPFRYSRMNLSKCITHIGKHTLKFVRDWKRNGPCASHNFDLYRLNILQTYAIRKSEKN